MTFLLYQICNAFYMFDLLSRLNEIITLYKYGLNKIPVLNS